MKKLIIDVTELANWQGRLTGVPRVMNELSIRFAGAEGVVFAEWNSQEGCYYKIDEERLMAAEDRSAESLGTSKKSLFLRVAQKAVSKSIHAKKAAIHVRTLVSASKKSYKASEAARVLPLEHDTLFILADWHASDPNFPKYLMSLKDQKVRLVQICYDLLPLVTPQYSGHSTDYLKHYVEHIYPLCDLVIAISENTKKDIASWLHTVAKRAPRVQVMRLGDDFKRAAPAIPEDTRIRELKTKRQQFILCVGTIEARKNHTLLYYVYKLASQRGVRLPELVIVGRRGWRAENIYDIMMNDPETKDDFIILQNASDEELAWLYANCSLSVYPSFYEGWGLPIAESIAYGVPCLASNTSSMPEVAGKLIDYFSPASSEECLIKIQELLKPDKLAQSRSRIGEYRPTAWDDTFKQVEAFLGSINHG